ncbi:MAG: ABC transporter ATP-binding protein [Anaerolineaceae bacterium]|nr:ABC transporter ATP-binding protein [Anaerolineaceae bacterium]
MSEALLDIRDLHLEFDTFDGIAKVLAGVNLTIERGDVVGLVGETGCGKSMTALAIPRLIRMPPGRIPHGQILFNGEDLLQRQGSAMQEFRARHLGMIFQDPTTNLNPLFTIREQLVDAVLYQQANASMVPGQWRGFLPSARQVRREAQRRAIELMGLVGIPDGELRINDYPHQFSGGMRQRVLIAMALAGEPDLLIADEPTTALDVTIQAQILRLVRSLVRQLGLTVLLITHNLGVVANTCDKVAVMYSGRVIEQAPVRDLFHSPAHPYTQGLIRAVPSGSTSRGGLQGIPGLIPNLIDPPGGCRFHPRCSQVLEHCASQVPGPGSIGSGHLAFCHLYPEGA